MVMPALWPFVMEIYDILDAYVALGWYVNMMCSNHDKTHIHFHAQSSLPLANSTSGEKRRGRGSV